MTSFVLPGVRADGGSRYPGRAAERSLRAARRTVPWPSARSRAYPGPLHGPDARPRPPRRPSRRDGRRARLAGRSSLPARGAVSAWSPAQHVDHVLRALDVLWDRAEVLVAGSLARDPARRGGPGLLARVVLLTGLDPPRARTRARGRPARPPPRAAPPAGGAAGRDPQERSAPPASRPPPGGDAASCRTRNSGTSTRRAGSASPTSTRDTTSRSSPTSTVAVPSATSAAAPRPEARRGDEPEYGVGGVRRRLEHRGAGAPAFFDRYTAHHHLRAMVGLGVVNGVFLLNAEFARGHPRGRPVAHPRAAARPRAGADPGRWSATRWIPGGGGSATRSAGWPSRSISCCSCRSSACCQPRRSRSSCSWPRAAPSRCCSCPSRTGSSPGTTRRATRGRRFGTANAVHALALVAVAPARGWLLDRWPGSWRGLYALAGVAGVVGYLHWSRLRRRRVVRAAPAAREHASPWQALRHDPLFLAFEACFMVYGLGFLMLMPVLPIYLIDELRGLLRGGLLRQGRPVLDRHDAGGTHARQGCPTGSGSSD